MPACSAIEFASRNSLRSSLVDPRGDDSFLEFELSSPRALSVSRSSGEAGTSF